MSTANGQGSVSAIPRRSCIMSCKRHALTYAVGAVGVILLYTVYHSAIMNQSVIPVPVGSARVDKAEDMTSLAIHALSETDVRKVLEKRLADVKSRLDDVDEMLEERKKELDVDEEMMDLALKHKTSVDRLIQKFKEVLLTNRTFGISVVGGSISVGAGVGGTPGIYATTLGHYLQKMLGSEVTVENGAIGATNSYYYGYCFETHCNVRKMDLLLWEFAHNDFGYPDGYLGQERLTRMILADLPNEPQLIYANFLHGRQILDSSCFNSERNGSVPLSKYYDVPSISMPDAVCKLVKAYEADDLLSAHDESHPGPKAHDMVGVFLAEFVKEVLEETIEILENQLSKGEDVKKSMEEGVRPNFENWNDEDLHQKCLPPVLFNTTAIARPKCWSLMGSEYRPKEMTLVPRDKYGWRTFVLKNREDRTDLKKVWRTLQADAFIEFEVNIKPYRDLKSSIAITTITCERNKCGYAKVYLDDEYVTTIDCLHKFLITVVHEVAFNVSPGKHVLKIVSLDKQGFNVASVSAAYQIPDIEFGKE